MEAREVNLTLDLCLRIGELLISAGAGAADATATMRSLAFHVGLRGAELDVTFTTVAMSYQTEDDDYPFSASRQVKHRTIDYDHVTQVDHLVSRVLADELDVREARTELGRITSTGHGRPRWAVTIGMAAMAAAVTIQLGGDLTVVALAAIAAAVIDRVQLGMMRRRVPNFYQQMTGAGIASLLAVVATASPLDVDVSTAITANIIVLLSGIGFMGALQDALSGFSVTAAARLLEVMLSTGGIIAGVSGGLTLATFLGISIPTIGPGETTIQGTALTILGAAIAASAFAYASYAPQRILLPIAVVAGAAIAIQTLAPEILGRAWPVGVAALFVGLVSYSVAGRMHVPPLIVVVPAVVPMLPGLSIYRGLTLLTDPDQVLPSAGLLEMFTAVSVAVALAAGVIAGEYVAQPLKGPARRLEARLAGPRLVGPVTNVTRAQRRAERKAERDRQRAERRSSGDPPGSA